MRKRTFGSGQLSRREDHISKRGDQNSRRGGPKSRVLGGQAFELGHAKLLWVNNLCGSGIIVLVNTKKKISVKKLRRKWRVWDSISELLVRGTEAFLLHHGAGLSTTAAVFTINPLLFRSCK